MAEAKMAFSLGSWLDQKVEFLLACVVLPARPFTCSFVALNADSRGINVNGHDCVPLYLAKLSQFSPYVNHRLFVIASLCQGEDVPVKSFKLLQPLLRWKCLDQRFDVVELPNPGKYASLIFGVSAKQNYALWNVSVQTRGTETKSTSWNEPGCISQTRRPYCKQTHVKPTLYSLSTEANTRP